MTFAQIVYCKICTIVPKPNFASEKKQNSRAFEKRYFSGADRPVSSAADDDFANIVITAALRPEPVNYQCSCHTAAIPGPKKN